MGEDEYRERLKESINNFIFCNGSPFMTLGEAEDLAIEMHSKFMAIHLRNLGKSEKLSDETETK